MNKNYRIIQKTYRDGSQVFKVQSRWFNWWPYWWFDRSYRPDIGWGCVWHETLSIAESRRDEYIGSEVINKRVLPSNPK